MIKVRFLAARYAGSGALCAALLAFSTFAMAADSSQETKGGASPKAEETKAGGKTETSSWSELSTEALQRQSGRLLDKRDALQNEIDQLGDSIASVERASQTLKDAPAPQVDSSVRAVQDAFAALVKTPPETVISAQPKSVGGNINFALFKLNDDASAPVFQAVRSVLPNMRTVAFGQTRQLTLVEQIADDASGRFTDPRQTVFLSNRTPELLKITNLVNYQQGVPPNPNPSGVRRAELESLIPGAKAEVDQLGGHA
ncbi:MAG TPA: hypothetical protein VK474_13370, partial [Chthoniobacterales bacterium]|nr:hypothetical protein [Chthoniobacterales bacterium]